jgi:hypothetical protein
MSFKRKLYEEILKFDVATCFFNEDKAYEDKAFSAAMSPSIGTSADAQPPATRSYPPEEG